MIGSAVREPPPILDVTRCALEQTGMQIEYIAGISLASWRTVKQKGKCTVRDRVLGQIVVDNEDVLALVHEILADRAAGIRRDILQRRQTRMRSRTTTMV